MLNATRDIPFFNYRKAFLKDEEQYSAIFHDVMRRGAFIDQQDLKDFEARVAGYLGVKHAIGVGNATDGLVMCWRCASLNPGDEVLFPSHTMVASPASVHFAGGVPVPVEIGDDGLMDPDALESALTSKTVGVMPVQLNGRTCDMDRIGAFADKHELVIIEDSAQALGSQFKGKFASTFGLCAAFSFYPAKILGCMGDGGMVVTDSDEVAEQLHLLRDHGRGSDGEVHRWGINSRLDNLQAAILDFQFKNYQTIIDRRREIASMYDERLSDLAELKLPPKPGASPDHFDVFQNYEMQAERRDELCAYLREQGIGTLVQWGGKAVHQWKGLGFEVSLPKTEAFFERCVMIPMNMTLEDDDVEYIAGHVRRFYRA